MAHFINKEVTYQGRTYKVISIHNGFAMFWARECGREFKTFIPFECVEN